MDKIITVYAKNVNWKFCYTPYTTTRMKLFTSAQSDTVISIYYYDVYRNLHLIFVYRVSGVIGAQVSGYLLQFLIPTLYNNNKYKTHT